ncbi:MAG: hypothetical protein IKD26_02980, partial [Clostridia bacterium]|nr:hypothetical protein [Clostridia bacterium]
MACSVIGICFATYYVNAQKSIVISTGNSKTLTITAYKDGGALSPEHPVTYNVTLDVPKDDLGGYSAYAGLQGKFYITVNTTNELTAATTITMSDGGLTPYDLSQMKAGIFYNLEDLPQFLVITFSVEDFNITIAEQQIEITMYWDFVEWAPSSGTGYLLGTYGEINNVWAPTYECRTFVKDPAFTGDNGATTNYAELLDIELKQGDVIKAYVAGWGENCWFTWDGANGCGELDTNGNLIIGSDGTYSIYLKAVSETVHLAYIAKNP